MAELPTFSTGNIVKPVRDVSNPNVTRVATGTSRFDSKAYVQQKYNEIYHDVDLYLDNSGNFDIPRRYRINPAAVLSLYISDTVNDWVVDGHITFMYLPEGLEGLEKVKTGQPADTPINGQTKAAAEIGEELKSYIFRGDGYDLLRIMIMPKSTVADGRNGENGLDISYNDTKWMLSYLFSIHEIEDVNNIPQLQGFASTYMKCLKLKFHDVRYQMLTTSNLEYSSADPKDKRFKPDFESEMAPGQGVLYTGDMLKDILNHTLTDPTLGGCKEFEITSKDDWDTGKAQLFYTSPAQWSAYDDLQYVFSHHVSEKELTAGFGDDTKCNDMCLMHTERASLFPLLEEIRLTPLSKFFEKALKEDGTPGELQKEHFFVTSKTQEVDITNLYKAPVGGTDDKNIDFKSTKYGQILSYSFVDMSPDVNSNMFCSTPVYSVDIGERQFNVEFKGNDIISARRLISAGYISKLFKEGDNPEELFLPTIHKNKTDVNVFPTFSLNGNNPAVRQRNGIHNLLYTGVFHNACICFKVLGLTFRESGTFIGIDRVDGCPDNDYNNKLYGQWFVVKVEHIFEAGGYANVIYAVKVHRHKPQQAKFENTIVPKK